MKVLSIDAWAGDEPFTWDWNDWRCVGRINKEEFEKLKTDQEFATWFYGNGYTTTKNLSWFYIVDDQYNITICDKSDGRPLFAIEYGPEY